MNTQPSNIEAEQAVLGALLLNNEVIDRLGFLQPEHFYEPVHAMIFAIAREKIQAGILASPVTLKPFVADDPGIKELGGVEYLARLAGATISIVSARDYATLVVDLYSRRQVIQVAEGAIAIAGGFVEDQDASSAITYLDEHLDEIRAATQRRPPSVTLGRALVVAMEKMHGAMKHGAGTPTGLASLDRRIGGLIDGDIYIIAGRPSMGKTALAVSLARRVAARGRVAIFSSLEMQPEDLAIRAASEALREGGGVVHYTNIRRGRLEEDEARQVLLTAQDMADLPIHIIESHVRRLSHLQGEVRRLVKRARAQGNEIGAVFIDYLGLIGGFEKLGENARLTIIMRGLKELAGELKVPLVVLAQLNRQVESRDDKRPRLSDLRDSGSIEQDADTVIFCYREEYYLERTEPKLSHESYADWQVLMDDARGKMDLGLAKQRMGKTGTVELRCDLATNSVWDVER